MPRETVQNILTELHERFGDRIPSAQQQHLMSQVEAHVHDASEDDFPDPSLLDTLELLLTEVEADHPHIASALGQVLETLKNMGV